MKPEPEVEPVLVARGHHATLVEWPTVNGRCSSPFRPNRRIAEEGSLVTLYGRRPYPDCAVASRARSKSRKRYRSYNAALCPETADQRAGGDDDVPYVRLK